MAYARALAVAINLLAHGGLFYHILCFRFVIKMKIHDRYSITDNTSAWSSPGAEGEPIFKTGRVSYSG